MSTIRTIDTAERRARLGVRHRLAAAQRTDDPVQITDAVVALHSSDPVTVYLSVTARMRRPSLDAVSDALYQQRSLVRHHAMRRTLWVFTPEVARLAHASSTVDLVKVQRRTLLTLLEATGSIEDPETWLRDATRDTLDALHRIGPATARRLGKEVPALGLRLQLSPGKSYGAEVAAHTRILLLLGFEGAIVRTRPTGTWINSEYEWTAADSWIDGGLVTDGLDRATAAAELTRRWLRSFGPATTADLQWWTGWTGATTKAALAAANAEPVDIDGVSGGSGWVDADDVDRCPDPSPWVALLPGLDPTTMGWKQRGWYLPAEHAGSLFDRNGNGGPTIWSDGRIVGGWVQRPSGEIAVRLLEDVGADATAAIEKAAHGLTLLLGETRFKVRFPAPMQGELLA